MFLIRRESTTAGIQDTESITEVLIIRNGARVGVICSDGCGRADRLVAEQRLFSIAAANLVALALEQAERTHAEEALRSA